MGFILLFPAQTFNSTIWFGFNSWAVAKPFSENIIKLLGSVTHIKTHKQHAGLQPRTRQRDKANSNLFTACLPNGTSYSSQMANPTTEGVIIQLPLTHRSGEEPEQGQDTEQLVTGHRAAGYRACCITALLPSAAACSWWPGTACSFAMRITLLPRCGPGCTFISSWQVCCLFVSIWMSIYSTCENQNMFKKNMPSLNFYLFIQNKQPDLLRYKFACVHDLKSIVGSFTE